MGKLSAKKVKLELEFIEGSTNFFMLMSRPN